MGKLIKALAEKQAVDHRASNGETLIDPKKLDFYQALYDFVPQEPTIEISLKKGDIVAILQKLDSGWWRGRKRDGTVGFVPANYLDIISRREEVLAIQNSEGKSVEKFI